MGEGTDRPVGERRRRREAERAAEDSSTPQPLTRRELRRRQAEEAARLEAIATGELPADELAERMRARAGDTGAGSAPSASSAARPDAPSSTGRSGASAASAPSAGATSRSAASAPSAPAAAPPRSVPSVPSAGTTGNTRSAASAASTGATPSARSAASAGANPVGRAARRSAATAASAPSAASAPAPARPTPAAAEPRLPSRRSLRELAEEVNASPGDSERPQERTATGRRPVVRTPSTAQGVRALDSTGRLTGIQPVVRPDTPPRGQELPAPLTDWSQSFSIELDVPARTARDAMPVEQAPRTSREEAPQAADERPTAAETADHVDEDDVEYPLRPKWVAIDHLSASSAEDAPSEPLRRTRRERPAEEEPAAATRRDNPAVTIVKIAVLALVALVIGVLIWLLATEAFAEGTTPAGAAPTTITTPITPEETRAR